jgi:hypothetical protein
MADSKKVKISEHKKAILNMVDEIYKHAEGYTPGEIFVFKKKILQNINNIVKLEEAD